ncbi:hypothetical protein MT325_m371L [Paramecium bursaria chlorella virus MT325]|uniref:Uncharacterized protein m371L n=1 Tax=Paramecium bursaria Chlorella virus MT325 TaxID=346932 RepID=A7IUA1_PBCVM|nr:hypothetical protein MT325_m371L [Paramecium bursaria chlorella virus MT325]
MSGHTCHQDYIDTLFWMWYSSHLILLCSSSAWFHRCEPSRILLRSFFACFPQCVSSHTKKLSHQIVLH